MGRFIYFLASFQETFSFRNGRVEGPVNLEKWLLQGLQKDFKMFWFKLHRVYCFCVSAKLLFNFGIWQKGQVTSREWSAME